MKNGNNSMEQEFDYQIAVYVRDVHCGATAKQIIEINNETLNDQDDLTAQISEAVQECVKAIKE